MSKEFKNDVDGELFLLGQNPPLPRSQEVRNDEDDLWFEKRPYQMEVSTKSETTLYERVLLRTKDPTSLPNTRNKCVKWATVGPIRTCIGWKLQYRWIYVTAELKVTTSVPKNIKNAVEDCLKEAVIIAAIAAIVSGGTAAASAAEAALEACLLRKFGNDLLTVSIVLHHRRGSWE